MYTALLICLSSVIDAAAVLAPRVAPGQLKLSLGPAEAFHEPTPLKVTTNSLTLQRGGKSLKPSTLHATLRNHIDPQRKVERADGSAVNLTSAEKGSELLVDVRVGGETVKMLVDTGSSDTWVAQKDFQCYGFDGTPFSQSSCYFGPRYNGTFKDGASQNQSFKVAYTDGNWVQGMLGYEDISIGGISVNAKVGLLTKAGWDGDFITSGMLGLAYPSMTNAYLGPEPQNDTLRRQNYDPVFTTMYKQGLVSPMFSIAIQRGDDAGFIAFGGLPPVAINQTFVSTPIQNLKLLGDNHTEKSFYVIDASYDFSNSSGGISQTVVDTGSTLTYLPTDVMQELSKAFSPPAERGPDGMYVANCNAPPPAFGVKVNGTVLPMNPADIVLQSTNAEQKCALGVQEGPDGLAVLGDTFLRNVVAVFDVRAAEMRFAPHEY